MRTRLLDKSSNKTINVTKKLIKEVKQILNKDIWNTIRGRPNNFRKACVHFHGEPGTGKTLLQSILTRGLVKGYIDSSNANFPLSNIHSVDVVIFEEGNIPFQLIDVFKKVLEGTGYPINKKNEGSVIQTDWIPVVATSNREKLSSETTVEDDRALRDRITTVRLNRNWYSLKPEDLDQVDFDRACDTLDLLWLKPSSTTLERPGVTH